MARAGSWLMGQMLAGMAAVLLAWPSSAQQPPAASTSPTASEVESEQEARLVAQAGLLDTLDWLFRLPEDTGLAPDVTEALKAQFKQERPRMRQLVRGWVEEELRLQGGGPAAAAALGVLRNRLIHEMTLWRLDSAGREHDARLLQAATQVQACALPDNAPYLQELAQLLMQVPAPERAAALQAEATLLARWGEPRPPAPALPAPWLDDEAWQRIDQLREDNQPPAVPLPPLLAWNFLVEKPNQAIKRNRVVHCRLRQWQLALLQAEAAGHHANQRQEREQRQRWLMVPLADTWFDLSLRETDTLDAYPSAAQRLEVTGSITVQTEYDAAGKARSARVVAREVEVAGVRGQRPLAFEHALDAASVRNALRAPVPAGVKPPAQTRVTINWKLE